MERRDSIRVLSISFVLILTFAFVEFIGGLLTNSLALISDAGHMLTDSTSLFIALITQYIISKVKTKNMTYGLYRLEVIAALVNSLFLLALVGYIIYEAVQRFLNPEKVVGVPMLIIAFTGLLINLIVGYILFKQSEENINVKAAFLHVVTDTLGSIAAIFAGIAIIFWELYIADPVLSIAISLLILPGIYSVIKDSMNVLLELVPSHMDAEEIEKEIRNIEGVIDVHDFHIWSITHGNVVLTAHVVVSDVSICNEILRKVEEIAKKHGINHTTVQIEKEGYACPPTCPLLKEHNTHVHRH